MKTKIFIPVVLITSLIISNIAFTQVEKTGRTATGNNTFAFELYSKLASEQGNLFFSPYSISSAFAMTYAGAKGNTEQEIMKVMHFIGIQPVFHSEFNNLASELKSRNSKNIEFNTANALWAQKGLNFLDDYLSITDKYYDAGLKQVDFSSSQSRDKTRKEINNWVEDQTKNKIKDLIQPGVLSPATMLVLVNAIYFYGSWDMQFAKEMTYEETFHSNDTSSFNTPFMHHKDHYKYGETDQMRMIELPYTDIDLSMMIILPKKGFQLTEIEQNLNHENYALWNSLLMKEEVRIAIPKFKMEAKYTLNKVLNEMGMTDAFSSGADFSGITGKKELFIDKVIHKAFVEVNETGTEAAAATAIMMEKSAHAHGEIKSFKADHPFVFIIKDNISGTILFIGRLTDPAVQ